VFNGKLLCKNTDGKYSNVSNVGIQVAIKTHISGVGVDEFKALLSELKIMAHVGFHDHVVNFLGAVTSDIKKR